MWAREAEAPASTTPSTAASRAGFRRQDAVWRLTPLCSRRYVATFPRSSGGRARRSAHGRPPSLPPRFPSHEAHVSTQPDPAASGPRVSSADEDARGPGGPEASPRKGAEAARPVDSVETRVIPATGPFPRAERIRRSREFQALSRSGSRRAGRNFVVLSGEVDAPDVLARLGVTVSRRVGNAVVRNAVKRRVREWFRQVGRERMAGRDVVVIARPGAAQLGGTAVFAELDELTASRGAR